MSLHSRATAALRVLDAETAHRLAIKALKVGLGPREDGRADPALATPLAGLALPNPVGLAAGFDKDAEVPDAMLATGCGFVECGTVTPLPQVGNPRPRLFRLSADRAVINRMGFNNKGLEAFAARLAGRARRGIVGANLGANKDSQDRVADYVAGLTRLQGLCDYFTVNVSSPNTPGLRNLQSRDALDDLLARLAAARADATPVFLKVAPDLEDSEIGDIAEAVTRHRFDGIIVSNTTLSRPPSLASPEKSEAGGLSGAPLFDLSTEVLRRFRQAAPDMVLIGVGGIASGSDAYAKIRAGAGAVQLYSALAYEGPGLIGRIKRDLAARLKADGFTSVAEAVGKG
jgi:dihydroorotate dehydrogenase